MNAIDFAIERNATLNKRHGKARPSNICRAIVSNIMESGTIIVHAPAGSDAFFECDVLLGDFKLTLKAGDLVLVVTPSSSEGRGVVLGLVGPYKPPAPASGSPKHLTLEAGDSLALKCGDSSIELRRDGVLVKGKDIVSHARRRQRIKGGTVAIN